VLRIIAYHRVAEVIDTPGIDPRSVSATPQGFAAQMSHLARHYHVVSMPDVLEALAKRRALPKRSVLITFDDGYADFADIAWPILVGLRLPATLFVATAYPGNPARSFWWDMLYRAVLRTSRDELLDTPAGTLPLRTIAERRQSLRVLQDCVPALPHAAAMGLVNSWCSQLGGTNDSKSNVLTWDRLRQLVKQGLTLGSHTRTHPILTQLPPTEIREEIRGAQRDLEREIGLALPIFCYPNGNHNDVVCNIAREEGIAFAVTTLSKPNHLSSADLLRLGRIVITPRTTLPIFSVRLLRLGAYLDSWRHRTPAVTVPQPPSLDPCQSALSQQSFQVPK